MFSLLICFRLYPKFESQQIIYIWHVNTSERSSFFNIKVFIYFYIQIIFKISIDFKLNILIIKTVLVLHASLNFLIDAEIFWLIKMVNINLVMIKAMASNSPWPFGFVWWPLFLNPIIKFLFPSSFGEKEIWRIEGIIQVWFIMVDFHKKGHMQRAEMEVNFIC